MDCLIIGENSALAQQIKVSLTSNINLFCTSRKKAYNAQNIFTLDLENEADIQNFSLHTEKGFAVICAAMSGFASCEQNTQISHTVNVKNTIALAKKLTSLGWKIVYPSSSAVFAAPCLFPQTHIKSAAASLYGKQKQEVERALLQLPHSLIVRFTKIIPHDFPLFYTWLKGFERGETVSAFSDYFFSPISATQAADALLGLIEQEGIWHVGAPDTISYKEAADVLLQAYKEHFPLIKTEIAGESIAKSPFSASAQSCTSLNSCQTETILQQSFTPSKDVVAHWLNHYINSSKNNQ